jgi:hypothetical protein
MAPVPQIRSPLPRSRGRREPCPHHSQEAASAGPETALSVNGIFARYWGVRPRLLILGVRAALFFNGERGPSGIK